MRDIQVCSILGVNINIISMKETIEYIYEHLNELRGKYICVSNVHTTVMSHDSMEYRNVQNSAVLRLPDGKPLSMIAQKRGYEKAERVTGPDLMEHLFKECDINTYRHYFYGSSNETLKMLEAHLRDKYPSITIAGTYSPSFGKISDEDDIEQVQLINDSKPDIVWVGLGAPKQENWMYNHQGVINSVMIGVGAGFDYHAGNIKRAPAWMQKCCLEWLYRLLQDPKRLFKRYFDTNIKFMKLVKLENKRIESEHK